MDVHPFLITIGESRSDTFPSWILRYLCLLINLARLLSAPATRPAPRRSPAVASVQKECDHRRDEEQGFGISHMPTNSRESRTGIRPEQRHRRIEPS